MYLLNAHTKQLEEFVDHIPQYAILSHTWEKDEILYENIMMPGGCETKAGWLKVDLACRQTMREGLKYVWIDTCCINKSSSAELSEAINSMFRWYSDAVVCFVYLKDVTEEAVDWKSPSLRQARWFTRGWTLQELIAPQNVVFYNTFWIKLGTKSSLKDLLHDITGISTLVLDGRQAMYSSGVATRMSWAATRRTTRVEDIAYCLLGIFGVNMPLLYGEGDRAFQRLQEEIIKMSHDQSLFAWDAQLPFSTALAKSPEHFGDSGNILPIPRDPELQPYSMTHMGLLISLPLLETSSYSEGNKIYFALLECQYAGDYTKQVAIYICETETENTFERCLYRGSGLGSIDIQRGTASKVRSIYIRGGTQEVFQLRILPVIVLSLSPSVVFRGLAGANGVIGQWNRETLTLQLERTNQAYRHDLAAGFVFGRSDCADCLFTVVVYFPHESSTTTQLDCVDIFPKQEDWTAEQWLLRGGQDLTLIHVRAYTSHQDTVKRKANGHDHWLYASIETAKILRQDVCTLHVWYGSGKSKAVSEHSAIKSRGKFSLR